MRVTTVASIVRVAPFYGQQVPALGQQKVLTSETQSAVQPNDGSQHVGSWVQTLATQGSLQPVGHSAAPAVQTLWHWQVGCVVVVVVEVVVVDEHANAPHVNAQLTSPTSHCAILRASPILQASSPFTSQTSG